MSSINHLVCLLCFAAVRARQPLAQSAAPVVAAPKTKDGTPSPSTTLKKMANNKGAEQASTNGSVLSANASVPGNKSSVGLNSTLCADKVIAKGAPQAEPCMGSFQKTTISPSKDHAGRPIYKNLLGNYMYFWAPGGNWIIENEGRYNTSYAVLFVHSNATCPEDAGKATPSWAIWDDREGGWKAKNGFTVTVDNSQASREEGNEHEEGENQENEEDEVLRTDSSEVEVLRIEHKAVVNEPSNGALMKLPLLAALLSFIGVLAYSLRFLSKICKGRQFSSQKWKSTSSSNEEAGVRELEDALDAVMPKMSSEALASPVVRKQVQANDEKESCGKGWDKDSGSEAGRGDDACDEHGWDDLDLESIAA